MRLSEGELLEQMDCYQQWSCIWISMLIRRNRLKVGLAL